MLRRFCISVGLSLALLGVAARARADVVGPEPLVCWPGTVGVSDHGGSRCERKAPDNCPSGWRGQLGGLCVVAGCAGGAACESGQRCAETSVCIEKRPVFDRRGPPGAPPSFFDAEIGICGPGAACDPPRRCEKRPVCIRDGEAATAFTPPIGQYEANALPRRGGCSGCTTGGDHNPAAALAFGAALALAARARRSRRR